MRTVKHDLTTLPASILINMDIKTQCLGPFCEDLCQSNIRTYGLPITRTWIWNFQHTLLHGV